MDESVGGELGPVVLGAPPRGTGPLVCLDRDGVLNEVIGDGSVSTPPRTVNEVRIVAGARGAVTRLRDAGFRTVVVTNQPDVARGAMSRDDALEITAHVLAATGVEGAYLCLHDSGDGCPCRKPRGGALRRAAADTGADLGASWMVGDRWVDIAAGRDAGVATVLVERPFSWLASGGGVEPPEDVRPDVVVAGIASAVDAILRLSAPDR